MTDLSFGSLFAGVGGFDLGFENAGWQCGFQVEWDKHCQQILARHWPDVPRWSDVSDVNGAELPPVDCITFGSPCQDLSVAGRRAGLEGNRSNLFFEATRIIKEMRDATRNQYPRIAVWENVPGALSSNKGADFSAVLDNLADIGALVIEWAVLDAQHFGVPQRRRRIFLVAVFDPAIARNCRTQIFPVTKGSRRNTKKINQARQEVAGTLGDGSGSRGWSPDTDRMTFLPVEIVGTLQARSYKGPNHESARDGHLIPVEFFEPMSMKEENWTQRDIKNALRAGESKSSHAVVQPVIFTAQRVGEPPRIYENTTPSLLSRMGTGGNNVPMIAKAIPIQDGREIEKRQNGLGVGNEGDPAYTLDTTGAQAVGCVYSFDTQFGSNANVFEDQSPTLKASQQSPSISTNYAVRRLTPLECERLMGWPDNHTAGQADTQRYKQCGNGVAAPVAQWVAQQLRRIINANQ